MSHVKVGNCPRCGSPLYAPAVWHSVTPPPTEPSCHCFPDAFTPRAEQVPLFQYVPSVPGSETTITVLFPNTCEASGGSAQYDGPPVVYFQGDEADVQFTPTFGSLSH